jgi:hypothetical protein
VKATLDEHTLVLSGKPILKVGAVRRHAAVSKRRHAVNASVASPALLLLLLAANGAAQDKRTYYTVQHPENFAINWTAFYDRAETVTDETRRRVRHRGDSLVGVRPKGLMPKARRISSIH